MKKMFLIFSMIIIVLFVQGCTTSQREAANEQNDVSQSDEYNNDNENEENDVSDNVMDEEYIKEKLTACTWTNGKKSFSFSEDGSSDYKNSDGVWKPKWAVRDNVLYLTYHSVYTDNTEKDELTYVQLDEEDVSNDMLACSDTEFYVSDNYLVLYGKYYYPE